MQAILFNMMAVKPGGTHGAEIRSSRTQERAGRGASPDFAQALQDMTERVTRGGMMTGRGAVNGETRGFKRMDDTEPELYECDDLTDADDENPGSGVAAAIAAMLIPEFNPDNAGTEIASVNDAPGSTAVETEVSANSGVELQAPSVPVETQESPSFVSILESQEEIGSLIIQPSADAQDTQDTQDTYAVRDAQQAQAVTDGSADYTVQNSVTAPETYGASTVADGQEALARMPKAGMPEQVDSASKAEPIKNALAVPETREPYPLENENEPNADTGEQRSYARNERASEKNEPFARADEPSAETQLTQDAPQFIDITAQKVAAAESMAEHVLSRPVEARNLFTELVERVDIMRGENVDSISVQLKPDSLGSVALKLSQDANGVHVQISADNTAVKTMLDARIASLVSSLEDRGIRVTDINVVYSAHGGTLNAESNGRNAHNSGREQRRGSGRFEKSVSGVSSAAADSYEELNTLKEMGLSSVMYSA